MPKTRILVFVAGVVLIASACSSSEDTTTTTAQAATSTTQAGTTTTVTATTTTAAATTTTSGGDVTTTTTSFEALEIAPTTVIGLLQPYSTAGRDLFPAASVEAHWYQWDGLYVVLYRGFDAASGQEICAGNSILVPDSGFDYTTSSPHLAGAEEICIDAENVLEPPDGVQVCGSLLYYPTEIPIDAGGTLYGTLEIGFGDDVFAGHTSQAIADAGVPEFRPGLPAYELPPSNVDDLTTIDCGV